MRKKFEGKGTNGFSYDPYVPERYRSKFLRYQLAEFDELSAAYLRSLTYEQLTMLKWMKRAKSHAESDHTESQRKQIEATRKK